MKSSKAKVAAVIEGFLLGTADPLDWGDFITTPLDDPALEVIRKFCHDLPETFPPTEPGWYCNEKGLTFLEKVVAELKAGAKSV